MAFLFLNFYLSYYSLFILSFMLCPQFASSLHLGTHLLART